MLSVTDSEPLPKMVVKYRPRREQLQNVLDDGIEKWYDAGFMLQLTSALSWQIYLLGACHGKCSINGNRRGQGNMHTLCRSARSTPIMCTRCTPRRRQFRVGGISEFKIFKLICCVVKVRSYLTFPDQKFRHTDLIF